MVETNLYKVTSCVPTKRDHYNVNFSHPNSGDLELSVHKELVIEYRLVVGKKLDATAFDQLQNDLSYGKAYAYAVSVLVNRLYTEKEMRKKMRSREVEKAVIDAVVSKLLETALLDDSKYTELYIESQVEAGTKSKERIVMDLRQKGISHDMLGDFDHLFDADQELAVIDGEIEKAWQRSAEKELTDYERKHRIVQSVARKGFNIDDVFSRYEIFVDER